MRYFGFWGSGFKYFKYLNAEMAKGCTLLRSRVSIFCTFRPSPALDSEYLNSAAQKGAPFSGPEFRYSKYLNSEMQLAQKGAPFSHSSISKVPFGLCTGFLLEYRQLEFRRIIERNSLNSSCIAIWAFCISTAALRRGGRPRLPHAAS